MTRAKTQKRQVLFVVDSKNLSARDNAIQGRLENEFKLKVVLSTSSEITPVEILAYQLVVLGSSGSPADFRFLPVPILLLASNSLEGLGMVSKDEHHQFGDRQRLSAIQMQGSTTSAGLKGRQTVLAQNATIGWGIAPRATFVAATIPSEPEKTVVFGYEKGAEMPEHPAPHRRTAFLINETPQNMTLAVKLDEREPLPYLASTNLIKECISNLANATSNHCATAISDLVQYCRLSAVHYLY